MKDLVFFVLVVAVALLAQKYTEWPLWAYVVLGVGVALASGLVTRIFGGRR
jgi:hypothetical protein